jgi:two-component system, LytTR family, sensor histidine kinase AlgZ
MADPRAIEPWLPDMCRLPRLGAMLGMAELVVVVVALAPDGSPDWTPRQFLTASGYAVWLALAVSVLLCVSRTALSALPRRIGAGCAIGLAAIVAAMVAAIVHSLFASVGEAGEGTGFLRFVTGSAAVVVLITSLALRYFYVIDRWESQVGAHARAEADALQARIRPHFLFNSMNMIATLLRRDPEVAERVVLDLSDLFRAALGAGEGNSSLAEEVQLSERYLGIEQLRLGDRLRVEWDKAEPLPWELAMPRLVLQPLLENAVLHGVSRLPEGGTIRIELMVARDRLRIVIGNPSPPPQAGVDRDGIQAAVQGAGHAQRSIAHRLGYAFGPRARMASSWHEGYYRCELDLPLP